MSLSSLSMGFVDDDRLLEVLGGSGRRFTTVRWVAGGPASRSGLGPLSYMKLRWAFRCHTERIPRIVSILTRREPATHLYQRERHRTGRHRGELLAIAQNDGINTNSYLDGVPIDTKCPFSTGVTTTIVDERYEPAPGEVISITIIAVPTSDRYPDGLKYAFHYGRTDGTTYLRYDNAHGIHERHIGEHTEVLESFPGVGPLLRRFRAEVTETDFQNEDQ